MATVYLRKTSDRRGFVRDVLRLFRREFEGVESVFVKPNIVSHEPYPTTTHPDVLREVLTALPAQRVVVGDAPAFDAGDADKILERHALRDVCREVGVPLVNLYKCRMKRMVSARGFAVKLSEVPLEFDYIVSLPVLKVHKVCGLTGALKNQFGFLSKFERIKMHGGLKNIHRSIAEVNSIIKPNLFIVDAVQTLVGAQEVRHGGRVVKLGYMMAGVDPVALDCVGLQLLGEVEPSLRGVQPEDIRHLDYAMKYGLGSRNFKVETI